MAGLLNKQKAKQIVNKKLEVAAVITSITYCYIYICQYRAFRYWIQSKMEYHIYIYVMIDCDRVPILSVLEYVYITSKDHSKINIICN